MNPYQKSIAATILLGLAFLQLGSISIARGWISGFDQAMRSRMFLWHRIEGYLSIAIILTIAFFCLRILPDSARTGRVWVHSVLGLAVISLVLSKVAIRRKFNRYYQRLVLLGVSLLTTLIINWAISAGWYLLTNRSGY